MQEPALDLRRVLISVKSTFVFRWQYHSFSFEVKVKLFPSLRELIQGAVHFRPPRIRGGRTRFPNFAIVFRISHSFIMS
jgi:hypothetical protein